ncbi:unnamed protein product [Camellia sinensis]
MRVGRVENGSRRQVARGLHAPPSRVFSGPIFVLPDSFFQNKIIYGLKKDINDHKNEIFWISTAFMNIHMIKESTKIPIHGSDTNVNQNTKHAAEKYLDHTFR